MTATLSDWLAARSSNPRPAKPDYVSTLESELEWSAARNLKIVSLVLSSLSLLAGALSMYWLVRMRRSFRHE